MTIANNAKIINIKEENANPFYDPDLACNGGGYYQPFITVLFENGTTLRIDDSSCGDFGSRIGVELRHMGVTYYAQYGSMLSEDEEYSDIPSALGGYIRAAQNALGGYHNIPFADDYYPVEEWCC